MIPFKPISFPMMEPVRGPTYQFSNDFRTERHVSVEGIPSSKPLLTQPSLIIEEDLTPSIFQQVKQATRNLELNNNSRPGLPTQVYQNAGMTNPGSLLSLQASLATYQSNVLGKSQIIEAWRTVIAQLEQQAFR